MRIDKLKINDFKNLKDFQIDIDESQLTSVFIGRNGAGKSNLLEAIVIIFRDLDLGVFTKDFSYEILYRCSAAAQRNWDCMYWAQFFQLALRSHGRQGSYIPSCFTTSLYFVFKPSTRLCCSRVRPKPIKRQVWSFRRMQ